ncbi:hypothetical protein LTR78_003085 [Recurvomyces mirabilis]|uniref:Uncharacterized protein n=1 Tax=Recurvomyces mirabilis TaxID=574656 RepID=A0AAE1C3S4_9PEZI|nr:hypothetical protein LTR78_003085 [Recurvomyces mirabilis]KAK5157093.1 hypothetical protein LTS14_004611 [Recurvomyces mirabilis]
MHIPNVRAASAAAWQKANTRVRDASSWALPKQSSSVAPDYVWSNIDQDPVPPEKRTWTGWSFTWYWFSDLVTIAGWSAASSVMTTGLSATDAILITLVAALCNAIPTVLNGAIGADLHITFPIAARASYGYWLSYFCVVSRGILALFWFGVQSAYGGQCVTIVIRSIWPSYAHLANHLPLSAGITTQGMVSYFLYWLIQFPFMLIPTHKLQYMFWFKTMLVLPTALAMVIWISVKAGGNSTAFFQAPPTVHGSERAWLWLSSMTSVTGGFSTLAVSCEIIVESGPILIYTEVNIPDFSRFAKKPGSQIWQLPMIPLFKCIVGVFGVVAAAAAKEIYGKVLWSPLDIMAMWLTTPGGRAAAFLSGCVWLLAQLSVNISANSISFANDITTLFPRWFNIRRGVIFAAFVGGWAMCPWIIIKSAKSLLSFLSAYAIFMAPMAGILFCDYWLVKGRKYDVPALYDPRGIYRYKVRSRINPGVGSIVTDLQSQYGVNWRALITTVVVIVPLLPGMANKVTPASVHIDQGLKHLFDFNWIYGFCLSIAMYWVLNVVSPDKRTLIPEVVHGTSPVLNGISVDSDAERQMSYRGDTKPPMEMSGAKEIGLVAAI